MSIIFSFGKWGGIYYSGGFTKRLCLGWMAITLMSTDIDTLLQKGMEREKGLIHVIEELRRGFANTYPEQFSKTINNIDTALEKLGFSRDEVVAIWKEKE